MRLEGELSEEQAAATAFYAAWPRTQTQHVQMLGSTCNAVPSLRPGRQLPRRCLDLTKGADDSPCGCALCQECRGSLKRRRVQASPGEAAAAAAAAAANPPSPFGQPLGALPATNWRKWSGQQPLNKYQAS